MAFCSNVSDWDKKRRQAQPYINRIRFEQEKKLRWYQQIGFLRRCDKSGLIPRGLRVKIPASMERSRYGKRMKSRSEKRVLRRTISDLYVKIKKADVKVAELNLVLSQELQMPMGWRERIGRWVLNSLKEVKVKVQLSLKKKFDKLKQEKQEEEKLQINAGKKSSVKKKVVYNNSSKQLTKEQLEVLSLGLNFGVTPKKFPLVEYVQAAELLCQRLEEVGDSESVEKARSVRNLVFSI